MTQPNTHYVRHLKFYHPIGPFNSQQGPQVRIPTPHKIPTLIHWIESQDWVLIASTHWIFLPMIKYHYINKHKFNKCVILMELRVFPIVCRSHTNDAWMCFAKTNDLQSITVRLWYACSANGCQPILSSGFSRYSHPYFSISSHRDFFISFCYI